jgi:hypothetical protein
LQPDINEKMRAILIDWLVEVHLKFKVCGNNPAAQQLPGWCNPCKRLSFSLHSHISRHASLMLL